MLEGQEVAPIDCISKGISKLKGLKGAQAFGGLYTFLKTYCGMCITLSHIVKKFIVTFIQVEHVGVRRAGVLPIGTYHDRVGAFVNKAYNIL